MGFTRRLAGNGRRTLRAWPFWSTPIASTIPQSRPWATLPRAILAARAAVLFDPASNLLRAAGPAFSSAGVQASVERRLPGANYIRVSYASGAALVMPALPQSTPLAEVLAAAHPRHAQTYAIALSGTLDGTGTRWSASYRWQPDAPSLKSRPSRRTPPRHSSTSGCASPFTSHATDREAWRRCSR